jgi:hypothetical protein
MSNRNFLQEYENQNSLVMYRPAVELSEDKVEESFLQSKILLKIKQIKRKSNCLQ